MVGVPENWRRSPISAPDVSIFKLPFLAIQSGLPSPTRLSSSKFRRRQTITCHYTRCLPSRPVLRTVAVSNFFTSLRLRSHLPVCRPDKATTSNQNKDRRFQKTNAFPGPGQSVKCQSPFRWGGGEWPARSSGSSGTGYESMRDVDCPTRNRPNNIMLQRVEVEEVAMKWLP